VRGGGAAAPTHGRPAPIDPALLALSGLLSSASAPATAQTSLLAQLTTQLSSLLASISSRIAALAPERGDRVPLADLAPTAAADTADGVPQLRQPPPPPLGPVLSLDPSLGTIVDPASPGAGSVDDGPDPLPSSWVPVPTPGLMSTTRRRLGSIVDRIDALLDEVGMTRMQLLLLMVLGPLAVAFLIDVVATIASGG